MTDLQKPLVNINGATRQQLIREHLRVSEALRTARITMQANRPHGRDYQTSREAFQYETARKAFEERIQLLDTLQREFEAIAYALDGEVRDL